jgi:hypothetical protein
MAEQDCDGGSHLDRSDGDRTRSEVFKCISDAGTFSMRNAAFSLYADQCLTDHSSSLLEIACQSSGR